MPRTSSVVPFGTGHNANNFDFARLVAALGVLFSHSYPLYGAAEPLGSFNGLTIGTLAVDGFFIMSGYLIAKSWIDDPRIHTFIMRRALRILPAFYAFLVVGTLLGTLLTTLSMAEYFSRANVLVYLKQVDVFDVQGVFPGVFAKNHLPNAANGSLWTIRIEAACYVIALAVGALGILRSRALTTAFASAVFAAYLYVKDRHIQGGFLYMDWESFLDLSAYFFSGSVLYVWKGRIKLHPIVGAVYTIGALALLRGDSLLLMLHIILPYALLSLVLSPARVISNAARYGDFSYGIYIWAFPVQQTVLYFLQDRISLPTFIALSAIGTVACAVMSWFLIERPMLRLKPSRGPARVAAQTAEEATAA